MDDSDGLWVGDSMRLFKAKRLYIYVFCVYAINALFLLFHYGKKSAPTDGAVGLSIVVPQVIGMLFVALVASLATRRTSSILERCILILTSIICLLFVASVLPKFGYNPPSPLRDYSIFAAVSCLTALLAGWRMLQLVMSDKGNDVD